MAACSEPRLTFASLKVLGAFVSARRYRACGADIVKETGVFPGTVYPILARFEAAGWLTSEWEEIDPHKVGRPARLYYQLTGVGQKVARRRLNEVIGERGRVGWVTCY